MLPALLVLLRVVLRVIPHSANLAPVGATAVFAGRNLAPGKAVVLVALAMFLGDAVLARLHGYAVVSLVTPFPYPRWVPLPAQDLAVV
jgi:hypothetical protein